MSRGYFGIGIWHTKTEANVGSLMRSAQCFGAAYTYTVGRRYTPQCSDTGKSWRHVPCHHYATTEEFRSTLPREATVVGIELVPGAWDLGEFVHPERAVYLLGAEDHGLSDEALSACDRHVQIGGLPRCLNVACAGSIVMYDRMAKVGAA